MANSGATHKPEGGHGLRLTPSEGTDRMPPMFPGSDRPRRTAIVIPAYNAERTLSGVLERVPESVMAREPLITIVNDGSTDGTLSVMRELTSRYPSVELRIHSANRGYGAAQKTGFATAYDLGADHVVLLHSDGQYAPEHLERVLEPLESGTADVVVGSRMLPGGEREAMPLARYIGNRLVTWVENRVFGLSFVEYHSGYMAYSRRALEQLPFGRLSNRFHFDGEMMLCAAKLGLEVAEVPITHRTNESSSSLDPAPYLLEVASVLVRYLGGHYDRLLRESRRRTGSLAGGAPEDPL